MASRLFGTKLLPEPMHTHCQLDPQEKNVSEILVEVQDFSFIKVRLKMSPEN